MRILGIDPGYAILGWGVIDVRGNRFSVVDYGSLTTEPSMDTVSYTHLIRGYREDFESHIMNHTCMESIRSEAQPVPCVAMCPAGVDVPGYVALLREGRYDDEMCIRDMF